MGDNDNFREEWEAQRAKLAGIIHTIAGKGKRSRKEWEAEIVQKLDISTIGEIRDIAHDLMIPTDNAEERSALEDFTEQYGGCDGLRQKARSEGVGYFYTSYTSVPCSYELFAAFCNDGDSCWCDKNCYDESEEEEEDEDDEEDEEDNETVN